ncbi:MAG: UvrD-helicase domain-containing protein, partial [Ktedonobacterales bacterium]
LGGAHASLQLWRWDHSEAGGVLWVRDDLAAEPRAFAIAHELGHLVLHRGEGATFHATCAPSLVNEQADADDLRREMTGVEEYTPRARRELEANAFAAELLAPAAEVRTLFAARPTCDVDTVARSFGVSVTLARQRLLAAVLTAPDADASGPAPSGPTKAPHTARDPLALLDGLDASQREAARATGPALIVAGPGTGKTATLVGRVAHLILERGRQPERVLALTFSNRAAGEMRQRLAESGLPAERMPVMTIHAFATTLLREYAARAPHAPDEPPLAPDFRILDETDGFLLAEDLLAEFPLRYYRSFGNPTAHLAALLQDFGRARDALWTPAKYLERASAMRAAIHDEQTAGEDAADERMESGGAAGRPGRMGASSAEGRRARACERARAYAVWDRALRRAGQLDFGGLIQRAVELLASDEQVLRDVRARYRDVLVDEFQDTNKAAAELLFLLADADGRGLWVVGDHRQAIYRWRGAAPSNMYRLGERYTDLCVHTLGVSYRSVPALLDLGHAMASGMATPRADVPTAETGGRSSAIDTAAAGRRLAAVRPPT